MSKILLIGKRVRIVSLLRGKDVITFEGTVVDQDEHGLFIEQTSEIIVDKQPTQIKHLYYIPVYNIAFLEILDYK